MMTKAEYLALLRTRFEIGRQKFIEMVAGMDVESFIAQSSDAWDRAREKYGEYFDMDLRNLVYEAGKEAVDGVSYLALWDDGSDLNLAAKQQDKKSSPIRFDEIEHGFFFDSARLDVE